MMRQSSEFDSNQALSAGVGILDSLTLSGIFALFLEESLKTFLEETGKLFLFPISAGFAATQAVLAWRQVQLSQSQDKKSLVTHATVETIAALGVGVAIVGVLAAPFIFAAVTPLIFTAVMAFKAAYHFEGMVKSLWQMRKETDIAKKAILQKKAINHAAGFFILSLVTIAVPFVMILLHPVFAVLAVAGGLIGAAYGGYQLYKLLTSPSARGYEAVSGQSVGGEERPASEEPATPSRSSFWLSLLGCFSCCRISHSAELRVEPSNLTNGM